MLQVDKIEIIQAIQACDGGASEKIPMLLGKTTLVRVYFKDEDESSVPTNDFIDGVLNLSLVDADGESVTSIGSSVYLMRDKESDDDPLALRLSLDSTLNFEFDVTELFDAEFFAGKESVKVKIEIERLLINGASLKRSDSWYIEEDFINNSPLKIHILGLRYRDGDETSYYPTTEHFENTRHSIANLYPVSECISSQVVVDADAEFTLPFSDIDESEPDWQWYQKVSLAHAQLLAHRTLDLDANSESMLDTWYYGMVDYPEGDFFRGAASGIQDKEVKEDGDSANFDFVSCGPVEDAAGLYAAHEIAHCLDLHHPGIGDQARVEPDYPNIEGYISVDRYPSGAPFDNPGKISESAAGKLWERYVTEESLANNHTLGLIIERYNKSRYQGMGGTADAGLTQLRTDLVLWKNAVKKYGARHLGFRWRNWKLDRGILSFRNHYDFMGYLQPKWISSFSYLKLFNNIRRYSEEPNREKFKDRGTASNICIIGLYNEILGTGKIKYVFMTHEKPRANKTSNNRSIRIRFDDYPVDAQYIHHKDRDDNKLGDPVFLKAGVFKCVISEDECFDTDDPGYPSDTKISLLDRNRLYLDIAQWQSAPGDVPKLTYRTVDRKLMVSDDDSPRCDCENQPFKILRTSPESENSDFYLKLIGEGTSNCSYIARARFFDREKFKSSQKIKLTNWITLGVNFPSSHSLYIDKNHCLLPASSLDEVRRFLFGKKKLPQPFEKIYQVLDNLEKKEERAVDLFVFAVELTCISARDKNRKTTGSRLFESTIIFKGMVIEKPHKPGEFYFIDSEDKDYIAIKKKFEEAT